MVTSASPDIYYEDVCFKSVVPSFLLGTGFLFGEKNSHENEQAPQLLFKASSSSARSGTSTAATTGSASTPYLSCSTRPFGPPVRRWSFFSASRSRWTSMAATLTFATLSPYQAIASATAATAREARLLPLPHFCFLFSWTSAPTCRARQDVL